jgi:hypothetical protein
MSRGIGFIKNVVLSILVLEKELLGSLDALEKRQSMNPSFISI